jgi:hypothetical protein
MWGKCLGLDVAAITYGPLARTDLTKYARGEPQALWKELKPTQRASLRRVVYEMAEGDVIYVKDGPEIVDRGIVTGKYMFDSNFRLLAPPGEPWAHQIPVAWARKFPPIKMQVGKSQQLTVEELLLIEAERIEKIIAKVEQSTNGVDEEESPDGSGLGALIEAAYYRESPARSKYIVPRHKKLSNDFCRWLHKQHKIGATQEQKCVDIRFDLNGVAMLAELKICFGVGPTRSIREALGQLLEYNHYPARAVADEWFIVLDEEPSEQDRLYILILREKRSLPLTIGWQTSEGFSFYPKWPS